jgi:hypothetical protein
MKLEYPLSDVLPSIDHARDRLLARIYRYRQDHEASHLTTDEDSALLYAYSKFTLVLRSKRFSADERLVLVTGQLSKEINEMIAEIGQLFGVLGEDVVQLV